MLYEVITKKTQGWQFVMRWSKRLSVWLGGIAVALVAIVFAQATERSFELFHRALVWHPSIAFIITPLGLGFAAWITIRFMPGAQGSGIPQTIAALSLDEAHRRSVLSLPIAAAKIVLRITSYNVCYTKLLRFDARPARVGAPSGA